MDWLFTNYPGPTSVERWGLMHIITLVACFVLAIIIAVGFKNKSKKAKYKMLWVLVSLILIFEIARRVINLYKTTDYSLMNVLTILLPRPWCAISCWSIIFAAIFRKKFMYNFATIISLLCALVFFAYPGVGFKVPYMGFDDVYSIATHSLLLVTSITMMSLGFTNFRYKKFWKVLLCFALVYAYAFAEIYFNIEADPLYFVEGNDIMAFLGVSHTVYIAIYASFIFAFTNVFFIINEIKRKKNKHKYLSNDD